MVHVNYNIIMKQILLPIVFAFLLVVVKAQSRINATLPIRINPVSISGVAAGQQRSCPSSATLESARSNNSAEIQLALQCGNGNWRQVNYIDMGVASQQCPSPWVEISTPARSCTTSLTDFGCEGVQFAVSGAPYSRVCGRAIGYGVNTPDAFLNGQAIDTPYVDGLSVTYGSPRQHIWSFAAGHGGTFRCPCDNQDPGFARLPPSFVGDNYFCDGNYNGALWDRMDCTTNCCTFNSPPWFNVSLPIPTSDNIEVRICADQHSGDEKINVRLLQFYVA